MSVDDDGRKESEGFKHADKHLHDRLPQTAMSFVRFENVGFHYRHIRRESGGVCDRVFMNQFCGVAAGHVVGVE